MKRRQIAKIDVGDDCILIYECGDKVSMVVTTRDNGDAEVFLDVDQAENVIRGLRAALDSNSLWEVWRQGDDGNPFLVKDGLSRQEADKLVATYEGRKHKQTYWVKQS